jgi:hypothetical protein
LIQPLPSIPHFAQTLVYGTELRQNFIQLGAVPNPLIRYGGRSAIDPRVGAVVYPVVSNGKNRRNNHDSTRYRPERAFISCQPGPQALACRHAD